MFGREFGFTLEMFNDAQYDGKAANRGVFCRTHEDLYENSIFNLGKCFMAGGGDVEHAVRSADSA